MSKKTDGQKDGKKKCVLVRRDACPIVKKKEIREAEVILWLHLDKEYAHA